MVEEQRRGAAVDALHAHGAQAWLKISVPSQRSTGVSDDSEKLMRTTPSSDSEVRVWIVVAEVSRVRRGSLSSLGIVASLERVETGG